MRIVQGPPEQRFHFSQFSEQLVAAARIGQGLAGNVVGQPREKRRVMNVNRSSVQFADHIVWQQIQKLADFVANLRSDSRVISSRIRFIFHIQFHFCGISHEETIFIPASRTPAMDRPECRNLHIHLSLLIWESAARG